MTLTIESAPSNLDIVPYASDATNEILNRTPFNTSISPVTATAKTALTPTSCHIGAGECNQISGCFISFSRLVNKIPTPINIENTNQVPEMISEFSNVFIGKSNARLISGGTAITTAMFTKNRTRIPHFNRIHSFRN